MRKIFGLFSIALACAAVGACSPLRMSFNVGFAPPAKLVEKTVQRDKGAGKSAPKIALIPVTGLLADARKSGMLGAGVNPVNELVRRLKLAEDDPKVRAVILRINSPGGTVTGSDIMYRQVRDFIKRTNKPVIASLGEVAASGAYYLALAADRIIAEPTSITGSVGVIMETVNVSGGLAKLGIKARAVTSGPYKDLANPLEPIRESHYKLLQSIVDEYYARFRGLVIQRRTGLAQGDVDKATDGRVMSGAKAVKIGLVDSTGGVNDAFTAAKDLAGVAKAQLVVFVGPDAHPATPFAATAPAVKPTQSDAGRQLNLVQVNLPGEMGLSPPGAGFYYLWSPNP